MFVVCVSFVLEPDATNAFLPLVRAQADLSVREEAGCHRFDVCQAANGDVFLYEIYTDQAAFDLHLKTAHFIDFDRRCSGLVRDKIVQTYDLAHEGGAA